MNRSSYEAVLGPIKWGIKSTSLPDEILNTLENEDDLDEALEEQNIVNLLDEETESLEEGLEKRFSYQIINKLYS